ncbi:MAG: hypothetical protein KZQ96_20035 [Candidatus Thiodiazotropha sp. (ex Lucinoma borealis)]|nr:hypothetical protein [Candidatus Thiodiazotropha sp. (ex Lucinoma borealis)]
MDEIIEVWNIFHDGSIVEAKGSLPNLSLRIEIQYLRDMFPGNGDSFWAHINGCTHIEYLNWEEDQKEKTLKAIIEQEPEILDVSQIDNMVHIVCVNGELDLVYEGISFEIDSGSPVSIEELDKGCNAYWNEWEKRGKST